MVDEPSEKALQQIISEMIETVKNSKEEVFNITEDARKEHENMRNELEQTKRLVLEYIEEGDEMERKVRESRGRLAEVSKRFDKYTEHDIHEVYEKAHALQTNLIRVREKEEHLREKRDDLERRLHKLADTIQRAEQLVSKISVIQNYLEIDFYEVNELMESAKEKQEFGLKIIDAQEEERRKLSREIHDGPAQMLANILLRSEIIERTLRDESIQAAVKELHSVREMVRKSLYETRRIIYDLRPMALDDLGLIPTMKKYIDNLADYRNMNIEFSFYGEEQRLPEKYEVALFRLMQESVQNAVKHANTEWIQVKLQVQKENIILIVKDRGHGFDPSKKKNDSFGLIGMRERVEMLEGKLDIASKENRGTTVMITIPHTPLLNIEKKETIE